MTPIHELLARIRWDPEFGRAPNAFSILLSATMPE